MGHNRMGGVGRVLDSAYSMLFEPGGCGSVMREISANAIHLLSVLSLFLKECQKKPNMLSKET